MEKLPAKQQNEAIKTLVGLWKNYDQSPSASTDPKGDWLRMSANPNTMYTFVHEAARQLAQYGMKGDNSEIGYLKNLDPQKYAERQAFYAKAFEQMKQGLLGDRFRDQVYRIMAGVHQPQSLSLPP